MYTKESSAVAAITDIAAFRNGQQPQKNFVQREVSQEMPWFQFYVGDVFRRTEDMSAAQFGAYILLLMFYWNHSRLPDDCDLQRVARVDGRAWRAMKDKVLSRVRQDIPTLDQQKAKARARSGKAKGAANGRWDANE
jgi:uncharacterized protein YdaU (DUF1376 family)